MRVAIVIGTRPEIIKMSPIIRACEETSIDFFIIHSGQHYSFNMDHVFFKQLKLPEPLYRLEVGSGLHGEQTARILDRIEKVLIKERPDIVLVEGDTNSVLAGALAASKLYIKVGHVEAGLRSYDRMMPEEINRVLADHCSDLLFAPTKESYDILLNEGIKADKIFVTGNTIVDAIQQNITLFEDTDDILSKFDLDSRNFFLVTLHRQENVDSFDRFSSIINGLCNIQEIYNKPVILPIHPRTKKNLIKFSIDTKDICIIDPIDYISFLQLEQNAKLVLTDSGGVQEEACVLGIPCVTLRDNTERHETIDIGCNILSGIETKSIIECVSKMINFNNKWDNPYGDGTSAKKILSIIKNELGSHNK